MTVLVWWWGEVDRTPWKWDLQKIPHNYWMNNIRNQDTHQLWSEGVCATWVSLIPTVRRWSLWRWSGHEYHSCPCQRGFIGLRCPSRPRGEEWGVPEEDEPGSRPSPDGEYASIMILEFPASRARRLILALCIIPVWPCTSCLTSLNF